MAKGYRWVRVQIPERLHDRIMKAKGDASWDDTVVSALAAMLAEADTAKSKEGHHG